MNLRSNIIIRMVAFGGTQLEGGQSCVFQSGFVVASKGDRAVEQCDVVKHNEVSKEAEGGKDAIQFASLRTETCRGAVDRAGALPEDVVVDGEMYHSHQILNSC